MPTARSELQRIAKGWITASSLAAGSYLFSNLSIASDQYANNQTFIPWTAPTRPNETPQFADRDRTLTGQLKQYASKQLKWMMSYMTFGMVGVWETAFYDDPDQSTKVTIMTYTRRDVAQYIQCFMDPLQLPGASGEAEIGGFKNVLIEFWGGQVIT